MKISFSVILIFILGCSHIPKQDRSPSSTLNEGLDLQFEKPWNGGQIEAENKTLEDLGRTIGGYVAAQAKAHQAWREELAQLERLDERGLSQKQKEKMMSLRLVLNDLPNSPGLATRDVHRKSQACLAATLKIDQNVLPENQKGLFLPGAQYDAIVRFSNGNPRNLPDIAPDARGMAVKLLPLGSLPQDTKMNAKYLPQNMSATDLNEKTMLDLLAINFPVFFVNDPEKYVKVNQAFLHSTYNPSKATNPNSLTYKFYEGVSVFLKGMNGWERELALNVNGSIILNPLHEEYWSMMAYRLGDQNDRDRTAIKFKWSPCEQNLPIGGSPEWTKSHDYAKPDAQFKSIIGLPIPKEVGKEFSSNENRYYLRENLLADLTQNGDAPPNQKKCFALHIQRYIDEDHTPVEDTTQIWLENEQQKEFWAQKFASKGVSKDGGRARDRFDFMMSRKISKPIQIATLEIEPVARNTYKNLVINRATTNTPVCENLSFDPWNNVPSSHKPLGIVGRMRKSAYANSKHQRHQMNGVVEPKK